MACLIAGDSSLQSSGAVASGCAARRCQRASPTCGLDSHCVVPDARHCFSPYPTQHRRGETRSATTDDSGATAGEASTLDVDGRAYLEAVLAGPSARDGWQAASLYAMDPWVVASGWLAWPLLLSGHPEQAWDRHRESLTRARELAHPNTLSLHSYGRTYTRDWLRRTACSTPVCNWFTEGFDTPDLREARASRTVH